jgi:hypothetical protein
MSQTELPFVRDPLNHPHRKLWLAFLKNHPRPDIVLKPFSLQNHKTRGESRVDSSIQEKLPAPHLVVKPIHGLVAQVVPAIPGDPSPLYRRSNLVA